jgi:hypothetical protein
MRFVAWAALLLAAGCSMPYKTPRIEEPPRFDNAAPFPGIVSLLNRERPVRVFWAHGMCSHDIRWVRRNVGIVARALNQAPPTVPDPDKPNDAYTSEVSFHTSAGRADFSFFVWSPLTAQYKENLLFDSPGDDPKERFKYHRASLNGPLKTGLINDCFTDAVVYAGKNGDAVKAAAFAAVCKAMRGSPLGGECRFDAGEEAETVVFVTESLGSKVLFDAIRRIRKQHESKGTQDVVKLRLAAVHMVFMAANQIPLLDQADPEPSSLAEFAANLRQARAFAMQKNRAVPPDSVLVAFTDPNDLLSYRLLRRHIPDSDMRLVNVIVSNDWTYFGYVERPDTAHCGYRWNPKVLGVLVHGYDGVFKDAPAPPAADNCLAKD